MFKKIIGYIIGFVALALGTFFMITFIDNWKILAIQEGFVMKLGLIILSFILSLISFRAQQVLNKKLKNKEIAVEKNISKEEIYVMKADIVSFITEVLVSAIFILPYIWTCLFANLWYESVKLGANKDISGGGIIFLIVFCGFITALFLFAFVLCLFRKSNVKSVNLIRGKLKRVYEVDPFTYNKLDGESLYNILVSYEKNGQEAEYLSTEVFSNVEIAELRRLEYIPLMYKPKNRLSIDKKMFKDIKSEDNKYITFKPEKKPDLANMEKVDRVADIINYQRLNLYVSDQQVMKRVQQKEGAMDGFSFFKTCFIFIFGGIFLFAAIGLFVYEINPFSIFFLFFVVVFVSIYWGHLIYHIRRNILFKKTRELGYSDFANDFWIYEPKFNNPSSRGNDYRLKYSYNDEFGKKRFIADDILIVSKQFFEDNSIEKIPIKIYKKFAVVDYEKLFEIKKLNSVDE